MNIVYGKIFDTYNSGILIINILDSYIYVKQLQYHCIGCIFFFIKLMTEITYCNFVFLTKLF